MQEPARDASDQEVQRDSRDNIAIATMLQIKIAK